MQPLTPQRRLSSAIPPLPSSFFPQGRDTAPSILRDEHSLNDTTFRQIDFFKSSIAEELKRELPSEILEEMKHFISSMIQAKIKQELTVQVSEWKLQVNHLLQAQMKKIESELSEIKGRGSVGMGLNPYALSTQDQIEAVKAELAEESKQRNFEMLTKINLNKNEIEQTKTEFLSKMTDFEGKLLDKLINLEKYVKTIKVQAEKPNSTAVTSDIQNLIGFPDLNISSVRQAKVEDSFVFDPKDLDFILPSKKPSKNTLFGDEEELPQLLSNLAVKQQTKIPPKEVFAKKPNIDQSTPIMISRFESLGPVNPNNLISLPPKQTQQSNPVQTSSINQNPNTTSQVSLAHNLSTNLKSQNAFIANSQANSQMADQENDSILKYVNSVRQSKVDTNFFSVKKEELDEDSYSNLEESVGQVFIDKDRILTDGRGQPLVTKDGVLVKLTEDQIKKIVDKKVK